MSGSETAGMGRRSLALGAIASLLLAAALQGRADARSEGHQGASPMLYLPSGEYLKVVSLGFDGILADLIYLWSIQYYGDDDFHDRYEYLDHIYRRVITELDPHYLDPYLIGSLIMSAEAGEHEMALRLLDEGIENNPDRWILAFEAGFICYSNLKDYVRAAGYFEQALTVPDVHPLVRRLYAEMYNRAGDKRTSLREWAKIHETSTDEYVRTVAWRHVHDLKVEVDLADLREGLKRFRESHGRAPRGLTELLSARILREIPQDPEGAAYLYNARTGQISYPGGLALNPLRAPGS